MKHIGATYTITALSSELWQDKAEKLIGHKGKLIAFQTQSTVTLAMLTGPYAPQVLVIAGCRVKLSATQGQPCACRAYSFPHRERSGRCFARSDADFYCGECGQACASYTSRDFNEEEYHASKCCNSPVFRDPSLTKPYEEGEIL